MKLRFSLIILSLILFLNSCTTTQKSNALAIDQLEGVWLITDTTTVTPEGTGKGENPQPGVYIFTKSHFSNMLVPNEERQLFDSKTTDAEKLAAFSNFVADCGTYEIKGASLITRNFVAKLPNAMLPGKESGMNISYQFSFENDELLLTLDSAWAPPDGKIIYRLKRLE